MREDTPPRAEQAAAGMALCLSGGGYRAVAFHTGVLWRLNELGLLPRLARISAVSGGAVLAGCLAMAWPKLAFHGGVAVNFDATVVAPVRHLLGVNIGTWATILGWLPGRSGNGELTRYFTAELYGGFALRDIKAGPDFVFCATDLRHGTLWTFDRNEMGNAASGWFDARAVPLATAVAAAAAFPVLLGPAQLDLRPYRRLRAGEDASAARHDDAILGDGGVFDDLALDPVLQGFADLLISDASEGLDVQQRPARNWPGQLARVRNIALSQVRLQRLARALAARADGDPEAALFALTAAPPDAVVAGFDRNIAKTLLTVPTKFVPIAGRTQEDLINWGYVVCAAAMRNSGQQLHPPPAVPYPSGAARR
jgi:NTE family protein